MKELTQHIHDNITVGIEKQYPKQHRLLGSIKLHKGLTLFELNLKTKVVAVAQFESVNSVIDKRTGKPTVHKKVITKDSCLYTTALNVANAERKFKIMLVNAKSNSK